MINDDLKMGWRNLKKNRIYSFINIFGLMAGLTSFLLIALYVFDEFTYDGFHKKGNFIYRVVEKKTSPEGKETKVVTVAANILRSAKSEFPEVAEATRFTIYGRVNISIPENENKFYEAFCSGDAAFLKVFDFPLLYGNSNTALSNPYTAIITDEAAVKMFGTKNVLGKILNLEKDSLPFTITAVINIPDNSHIKFNVMFSEATRYSNKRFMDFINNDWSSNTFTTYLLLKNKDASKVAAKIDQLVKANRRDKQAGNSKFSLQPLKDIHFRSAGMEGNTDKPGNIMHMYVFGIVAFLVLLIACINYMNLATARFAGRSKEIAVRKVLGASRSSLIRMFLAEASFITLLAFILSLGVAKLSLPWFNQFTEKTLTLGLNTDYRIWAGVLCVVVFAALLSGIYPALFQSRLRPYLLLKSKLNIGKGNLSIRQVLVVVQFSMSIIMIIATIIVYQQMKYVDTADMGFNKEQLVVVDINSGAVRRSAQTIKTEFNRLPGVRLVSITSRVPGEWKAISKTKIRVPGKMTTPGDDVYFMGVDEDFLKTYNMKLLKGRNFSASIPGDSTAVIINEQAAALFGITEPSEQNIQALTESYQGDVDVLDQPFNARVIGIVKDFNFQSMREKVAPMILGYQNNPLNGIDYFTAKIATKDVQVVLKGMQSVLHGIDASHLFEYNFLDKQWELFYREDQKRQIIFLGIAILTILIACLGLLGLATFAAQQRIKEIGIRKVVGASAGSIVAMLSKDFLKLVIIATLIALPIAWWSMNKWLQGFAYHVNIAWWVFALAMFIALIIALITVSTQAIKAAMANPVKSLRTE